VAYKDHSLLSYYGNLRRFENQTTHMNKAYESTADVQC